MTIEQLKELCEKACKDGKRNVEVRGDYDNVVFKFECLVYDYETEYMFIAGEEI